MSEKQGCSRRIILKGAALGGALAHMPFSEAFAASPKMPEITVDQAHQAPIPLVIAGFGYGMGQQIENVIAADLQGTGLFRIIKKDAVATGVMPPLSQWKGQGVRAALIGSARSGGSGQMHLEMRLWDAVTGHQLQGTSYTATSANWRRMAHMIADVAYFRLLGEPGYFDTRIAYIALTGPRKRQITRLAIMDQDGANNHFLTDGRWLTLEPRFNPANSQIAFLSYAGNRPQVYLYNLQTGQQTLLGTFDGISYAPRFSPDGRTIILAVTTRNGGSDIYTLDLATRVRRRLTDTPGVIDTSPCYSPDGQHIVFTSDRGGSPQLYVMNADGSGAHRISYGAGHYGGPVWSPRGDLIAFTRIGKNGFALGLMGVDGMGERILTQGFTVESPSFAPNGRVLVFNRQTAAGARGAGFSSTLHTIDISGFNERPLRTATGASDPAWSPLRKG